MIDELRSSRLVRAWARVYTRGLPESVADRRRCELASDLWEQLNDPDLDPSGRRVLGRCVLGRCVRGVPADLSWHRAERRSARRDREEPAVRQRLHGAHGVTAMMRERWYLWFVVAAACFGAGLMILVLDERGALGECTDPDTCVTGSAVWAGWLLSWLAAATFAIAGLAVGVARFVDRRRP